MMPSYTLSCEGDRSEEMFDRALAEPVLVDRSSGDRYVLMSAEAYKKLVDRLSELEDRVWGQRSQIAIEESQMVGEEQFTSALQKLANGET